MSKLTLFIFLFSCLGVCSSAQEAHTLRGSILDSSGAPLAGASILLNSATDTMRTAAGPDGSFLFKNLRSGEFQLLITFIGFEGIKRKYSTARTTLFSLLDPIRLKVSTRFLKGVTVNAVNPVEIKEDTVEYKASAYKVRPGSAVEELIRKLPGVTVDKDGIITAQGQQITKIRVNGKDFFAGDVQTATKNIPAEIVDKLQVIDDYGDQANITGIKTGDSEKILNLDIRKDRNKGYFMQGLLGLGNDGRYVGNLSVFSFQNQRQISLLGTLNNTNLNSFKFGSAGTTNSQNANGITTTRSLGTNYRDAWGRHIAVYGSYSFSDQQTQTLSSSMQQTVFQQLTRTNVQQSQSLVNNTNHRFSFNFEYKPDTVNYLKVTPTLNFTRINSTASGTFIISRKDTAVSSAGTSISHLNSSLPNAGLTALYNHRFHKKGRNFSMNLNLGISSSAQTRAVDAHTSQYDSTAHLVPSRQFQNLKDQNSNRTQTLHLSYTEPLGKIDFLEFNYNLNNSGSRNQHLTRSIDPLTLQFSPVDSLSNDYKYQFTAQRLGLNYRVIAKKYNLLLGFAAQPSVLHGQSLTRALNTRIQTFNLFPVARYVYTFSKGHALTFRYNGSSNAPSFSELQPVTDRSRPLQPVTGNPALKAAFTNNVSLRYNQFDYQSGTLLFSNLTFSKVQHEIVTNSLSRGDTLYTKYRNASGFYAVNSFVNFSKPFDHRMFTASVSGSANYSNNISFINDQQNAGHNWVLSPVVRFRADLDTLMDTEISTAYTVNSTRYSIPSPNATNARTWVFALNGRNFFFKDWILGYDLTKTLNHGYSATRNADPLILNLYLERQFLKKNMASIRIQAFDLFNQNTGISRSVAANSITDSQVNRLARYFLLSFSLRLQQFAGKMQSPEPDGEHRRGDYNGSGGRHHE